VFVSKLTTRLQSNTTHVYFNSFSYLYMYAACFGLYLVHPQACQHKNVTKEDTISFACVFEITLQVWKGHMCGPDFAHRRSTSLSAHRPLQLNCEHSGCTNSCLPLRCPSVLSDVFRKAAKSRFFLRHVCPSARSSSVPTGQK